MLIRTFGALAALALANPLVPATAADQADHRAGKAAKIAVTIYNQGFGLVKERRPMELSAGRNRVIVEDVAAQIDPTSVSFKSLTAPDAVSVREQNYLYDLMNPTTMLNKSVGKRVTIRQMLGNGQIRETVGTIMSPVSATVAQTGDGGGSGTSYGGLIVRTEDGKLLLNPPGEIALHEMPAGLIARPQLAWIVDCDRAGAHDAEVSYMTNGITWRADYVVTLANDDRTVDITGWVTLDNKSGATYANAALQLVAGDVRRVEPARRMGGRAMMAMDMAAKGGAGPQFQEEQLFEYHLYTLDGVTTVRDNEQKQMTLLTAAQAPCTKKLIYDGRRGFWGIGNPGYQPGEGYDTSNYKKCNVIVEIKNAKPNLGLPLPKGRMRLYKTDARGALQFVGEDQIDHTPTNETIRLYVGDSFDVVGEHKRTNFKRISDREVEESFEVQIRNHRKDRATVAVVEHLWADWKITQKSTDFVKKDASTAEFPLTVEPDGQVTVTYTVRTRW